MGRERVMVRQQHDLNLPPQYYEWVRKCSGWVSKLVAVRKGWEPLKHHGGYFSFSSPGDWGESISMHKGKGFLPSSTIFFALGPCPFFYAGGASTEKKGVNLLDSTVYKKALLWDFLRRKKETFCFHERRFKKLRIGSERPHYYPSHVYVQIFFYCLSPTSKFFLLWRKKAKALWKISLL